VIKLLQNSKLRKSFHSPYQKSHSSVNWLNKIVGLLAQELLMLQDVHPKLPMRNKALTHKYYSQKLGFSQFGTVDYDGYLMLEKDGIQIHFFEFKELDPRENYGQVYIRTDDIDALYASILEKQIPIHPNGKLHVKPWGQKEFSLLDPDNNLLTFGQYVGVEFQ